MLRRLVLEGVFVEDLVLTLASVEAICEAVVILELLQDGLFRVLGPHGLILYLDLVESALIDQPLILVVPDLTLLTGLELFPGLLFDHGSIGVEVLTLKSDLLELLSQASLLLALRLLLLLNLSVHLKQALLASGLGPSRQSGSIVVLLLTTSVILGLAALASLLDLRSLLHEALRLLLLAGHVSLTLEFDILLVLSLLELKTLT